MRVQVFLKGERNNPPVRVGEEKDVAATLIIWRSVIHLCEVYDGSKYEDAAEFVKRMGGSLKPAGSPMTAEKRMRLDESSNAAIHARNEMIVQWIAKAIRKGQRPEYEQELLAKETARKIIRLFY